MMMPDEQIQALEGACNTLLAVPKMRFVGVISKLGKLIVGRFGQGVTSHLSDKEDGMAYMELAMEIFLREEFDEKLGKIDYVLSKRKKINMISMPVGNYLILISTERDADVDSIVKLAGAIFSKIIQ